MSDQEGKDLKEIDRSLIGKSARECKPHSTLLVIAKQIFKETEKLTLPYKRNTKRRHYAEAIEVRIPKLCAHYLCIDNHEGLILLVKTGPGDIMAVVENTNVL